MLQRSELQIVGGHVKSARTKLQYVELEKLGSGTACTFSK